MKAAPVRLNDFAVLAGSGETGLTYYLDCHVYLLESEGEFALVDAGSGINTGVLIANIRQVIGSTGKLRYLLLTHCHGDHAGGVRAIQSEFADVTIATSPFEARMLANGSEHDIGLAQAKHSGVYPRDFKFHHVPGARELEHNQEVPLGAMRIRALYTPGHTQGSVCFLAGHDGVQALFTGDTVFWGGLVQLLNVPGSELAAYRDSAAILASLDPGALFPGHGLWVLQHARTHLLKMAEYFRRSAPPPMPASIEKVVHE